MSNLAYQPMIDAGLAFDWSKLPAIKNLVADCDSSAETIRLIRSGRTLAGVSSLKSARNFWAGGVNDSYLRDLCELNQLEFLYLGGVTAKSLEPIKRLASLRKLHVMHATKIDNLNWLEPHDRLTVLSLENMPKVTSFDGISHLTELTALALNSGLWKDWRVESLKPLMTLKKLRVLSLIGVRASDKLLEPLTHLPELKILRCPTYYPATEFNKLRNSHPTLQY